MKLEFGFEGSGWSASILFAHYRQDNELSKVLADAISKADKIRFRVLKQLDCEGI